MGLDVHQNADHAPMFRAVVVTDAIEWAEASTTLHTEPGIHP